MITLDDLLTSSGKYLDREKSTECTDEVRANGQALLDKVNPFLSELGITEIVISSGFRTSEVNASTPNSAKRSLHMVGSAIDILDDHNQTLAKKVLARPDLLKKYELWIEDIGSTKGKNTNWVHLDQGIRTDRTLRMFKP